ncbi:MAG TPA: flagellar protein FliS [Dongiaceae bacterium]|jgi:flagellin-specific chaperone FliS|nr:flagellar protein FliS [Dongiaceae bacterium]
MFQTYARAAQAYRAAIASSSSSLRTLLFLYDMMIAHLLKARDARGRGQFEISFHELRDASRIALALPTTLDRARAGKLAATLERFYLSLSCRIVRLSRHGQPLERFDRMIEELRTVRATWQEVARATGETIASPTASAPSPTCDTSNMTVNG